MGTADVRAMRNGYFILLTFSFATVRGSMPFSVVPQCIGIVWSDLSPKTSSVTSTKTTESSGCGSRFPAPFL